MRFTAYGLSSANAVNSASRLVAVASRKSLSATGMPTDVSARIVARADSPVPFSELIWPQTLTAKGVHATALKGAGEGTSSGLHFHAGRRGLRGLCRLGTPPKIEEHTN